MKGGVSNIVMAEHTVDPNRWIVLSHPSGRVSYWPEHRPIPAGWSATSIIGNEAECLAAIAEGLPRPTQKPQQGRQPDRVAAATEDARSLGLSMMFFGDSEEDPSGDKYRFLFDLARFADDQGFRGLWLPERHFTKFGCLFPSPPILCGAIAQQTTHLRLRAGSVVMPLHDPIRVAEEWSVVDNLSRGRVEVAFASGWHPDDFILAPETYSTRVEEMFTGIAQVHALWSGQSIIRRNGAGQSVPVRIYPTPRQATLPTWLTAAGNPATFHAAGRHGYGVLTHLFHQDLHQLCENVQRYRQGLLEGGHGIGQGRIAVTLHTFIANSTEEVIATAGRGYCQYMRNHLGLLKHLAFSQGHEIDEKKLSAAELDSLLDYLLKKFVGGRSMMGTIDSCLETCRELAAIGIDEIACLMDFGPDPAAIRKNLPLLAALHRQLATLRVS